MFIFLTGMRSLEDVRQASLEALVKAGLRPQQAKALAQALLDQKELLDRLPALGFRIAND